MVGVASPIGEWTALRTTTSNATPISSDATPISSNQQRRHTHQQQPAATPHPSEATSSDATPISSATDDTTGSDGPTISSGTIVSIL